MLHFSQIMQNFQNPNASCFIHGLEASFSLPVLVLHNQKRYDAMFLYHTPARKKSRVAPRPFRWFLLCAQSGKIAMCCDCAVQDFVPTEQYPIGSEVDMSQPKPLSTKKYKYMQARLLELYDQIRAFAFEKPVHPAQQKVLDEYKDLFIKFVYTGHYPFYQALAPDFFAWLNLSLASNPTGLETAATVPTALKLQEDREALQPILEQCEQLKDLFNQKIARDLHKEKLFDALHSELQEYKNGLADTLLLPLERDIIKLIDDIRKTTDYYRNAEPDAQNFERLLHMYEGLEMDLTDVLYRYGAEPYSECGQEVVPARQMIVSTIDTIDPKLDKKIAVRHVLGWEKDGRVIRPERVSVYLYTPQEDVQK